MEVSIEVRLVFVAIEVSRDLTKICYVDVVTSSTRTCCLLASRSHLLLWTTPVCAGSRLLVWTTPVCVEHLWPRTQEFLLAPAGA